MVNHLFRFLLSLAILWSPDLVADVGARVATLGYEIVAVYPHDSDAYTQGLVYRNGTLYESTGLYGQSTVREVDVKTGNVRRIHKLKPMFFGEGLTGLNNKLYQLTWKNQTGFIYNISDFKQIRKFHYPGEGWGLTDNGTLLIQSNGSDDLTFIAPNTFNRYRTLKVKANQKPVSQLNELEFVKGSVYANVYRTDRIAKIDIHTGEVTAWIDLSDLRNHVHSRKEVGYLNGIAYMPEQDLFLITGKRWPRLFLIRVADRSGQD